jgi:dephospho-CoA kinase
MSMGACEHGSVGERDLPCPHAPKLPCVLGLLGGIGSGKSTVAALFAEQGATVIDADAIVAELHGTDKVKAAIEERWGTEAFRSDGTLDRERMARIVFDNPDELAVLNAILHPLVIERVQQRAAAPDSGLCVIDAPLLIESGLDELCDATVFVECDATARQQRVANNRNWDAEEIKRREQHQEPLARKRKRADYVVNNGGDIAATRKQIERIMEHVTETGD